MPPELSQLAQSLSDRVAWIVRKTNKIA